MNEINFEIEKDNLYREESITDLKVGSIRRLVPIKADGSDDTGRTEMFMGSTQLMSPEGPVPLSAPLEGNSFEEAMDAFPAAMKQALEKLVEEAQRMQQQMQQKDESRIIVPGRDM
ncbi:MAG: cytoplasmic protein [Desulfobacterales bacterium]|nr:cytoplasmic protein [Desulfobacterales bacterium]